ncbi:MAG: ribonuclease E/G [Robiginitomaculum sp.]|nr:ribonuclease E/G [Robiginitomaculum sp.]
MVDICRIDESIGETRACVFHKKQAVEFYVRRWSQENHPRAGDQFSGRVQSIDKNMMAAFIDLGKNSGPAGLLRFTMSPNAPHLIEGQMLSVKIIREAEPNKGPLLSYRGESTDKTPSKKISVNLKEMIKVRYPDIVFEDGAVNGISWAVEEEVALKIGGYIYIEHTRAATMIDIDTAGGQKTKVSIEAAKEIAKQIRQRGIGGLVLIDFPNFRKKKDRADVWQTLVDGFKNDPNTVKIGHFSRFDTVELTRSRSSQTIAQILLKDGKPSSETIALQGLRRLLKEARLEGGAKLVLDLPKPPYDWLMADHIKWRNALTDKIGARFTVRQGEKLDVYKDDK